MLKGFYSDPENWEVVVLDFDLSWHRGALELSVAAPNSITGFLAPEQIVRTHGVSTRSAAVDSYGLGMTMLFLCSGKDPVFDEPQHKDWRNRLYGEYVIKHAETWRSIPRRFARLIEFATRHVQAERWDVTQIVSELERLHDAQLGRAVDSAELLAEELAARCRYSYEWNADRLEATLDSLPGLDVKLTAAETRNQVDLSIYWAHGHSGHRKLRRWIPDALNKAASALRRAWSVQIKEHKSSALTLTASVSVPQLFKRLDAPAEALGRAITELDFS
jgi:hypothetical protein